jgi:hypothetical protein
VVRWARDADKPAYRGNGIVLKDQYHGFNPNRTVIDGIDVTGCNSAHRTIWDGETWWAPYKPFCMLRCALDYARKAHRQWGEVS